MTCLGSCLSPVLCGVKRDVQPEARQRSVVVSVGLNSQECVVLGASGVELEVLSGAAETQFANGGSNLVAQHAMEHLRSGARCARRCPWCPRHCHPSALRPFRVDPGDSVSPILGSTARMFARTEERACLAPRSVRVWVPVEPFWRWEASDQACPVRWVAVSPCPASSSRSGPVPCVPIAALHRRSRRRTSRNRQDAPGRWP